MYLTIGSPLWFNIYYPHSMDNEPEKEVNLHLENVW